MILYYKRIIVVALAFILCLVGQENIYAQKQPVSMAPPLVGDSVKTGKTFGLQDTVYYNPALSSSIAQTNSIDNIVSLQMDEFLDNKMPPDTFHVIVRINVNYTTTDNTSSSRLDTLNIFYSKDHPYNNKAVKLYRNYRSVQVEILDVAITGATATLVRPLLRMDNMMVIDRNFVTDCIAINSITHSDDSVATEGELIVSWPAVSFIPSYDLEWTFIDKAALDSGSYGPSGSFNQQLIFRNNSSRVTVSGNSYKIPLLYDGEGSVFFRVRTLQNAPDGQVIAGTWSSEAGTSGLGEYEFTGHQPNLNWQATTTFAEDGKRKSVVQYYDGSLKGRQTVTKDNTTKTTVVAETLYDKQGRPVIQVLPSPTLSTLIAYTPLFNQKGDITLEEYDKSVYDTLINDNEYCATGAPPMGTAQGSSQYYSPANPMLSLAQQDHHRYVPDAEKYPFTETRYTRDNTGRIDRQGGVGAPFQIGTGHETKYFYGSAEQKDLDALFGTEAGDESHYEKNMVRDANGQYSVSYVDMHGRTIATALAGDSGTNLDRLPSYESVMQTDNLLNQVNNIIKDNNIQSSKSILVAANGAYEFNYSLSPESLSLDDCNDVPVCYDCLYDLTITISDNCNNEQFGGSPVVIRRSNFSLFKEDGTTHNLDTTCTTANSIVIDTTVNLQEGSYDITKTLSISKSAMQYYRDSLFLPHNTCKTYNQLVIEMLDSIRQNLDCTPDSAVTNLAVAYREQMVADLTPLSGQYASTATNRSCFSIFSPGTSGKLLYQGDNVTYVVAEGETSPKDLSPEDFIANFQDSWAEDLLPLHPEYKLLLEYEKLKSAYNWEADFLNTQTYADAVAKGFLNPTGNTNLPASKFTVSGKTDSLFIALGIHDPAAVTTAMQFIDGKLFQYLQNPSGYYTLWGLSTGIVKCTDSNNQACFDQWNQTANIFDTTALCTGDLDMAWRMFSSQYLMIREDWIDQYTRQKSGIYPGLIGASCTAVFPNRDLTAVSANQQYGEYNGTAQDTTTAKNNLNEFLLDNCEAFATKWWHELAPCGYTPADSLVIIPKLIQVAYEGADKDHPFGASTVKPSSTHTDRSFEEVLTEYNAIHYPSMDPVTCNAYLISNPKPYDQPGMIANLPIIAAPDSCACNRINELYYKFIIDSSTWHSFSNYMLQRHDTRISQGTLDTLRSLCNNTTDCEYLENPILLPPSLQCGITDACIGCTEVKALKDSFDIEFPGITPTQEESDTTQQKKNRLFANFMNHHLGFSKQAYEYLQFLESCPDTIATCDSTYWTVYNPGNNLQINTDLYLNSYNNMPPVSQFFTNGYFNAPLLAQAGHYVLVNKRDSLDVDTATVLMQWRVKPTAIPDMVNPFIRRGNTTTYIGAEWIKDPTDTTWWIGATLVKAAGGNMIGGMGLQSNSHALQADWVKLTNAGTGTLLYFNNFTWAENCPGYATGPFLCGKQAADSSILLNMNPCADTLFSAVQGADYLYEIYRQKLKGSFEKAYMKKCLDAGKLESFTVTHPLSEYHYTLYYYDQAGNLVKTVPPEGVHLARRESWFDSVKVARSGGEHLPAPHTLATTYRYNSLNQVISQHSYDGGLSRFWYDRLGRLVVSQNAKQLAEGNYSYTLYDSLGRIKEVGQKKQVAAMTDAIARNQQTLGNWLSYTYTLDGSTVISEQVTSTVYDIKDPQSGTLPSTGYVVNPGFQKAYTLRNRVSFTRYFEKLLWNGSAVVYYPDYDNSTTYSYDIHGNVDTLLHNYRTGLMAQHSYNQYKAMAYRYDLISGKVNEVHYQPGMPDELYHRYDYDAENRLINAYTTDRKALMGIQGLEEHEAFYQYYKHGPLARTVLGQQQVQGVDYAYTLQGWLKGVNSDSLLDDDGKTGSIVGKDAYRFSLNYFNGDYAAVSTSLAGVFPGHTAHMGANAADYKPLYNGNISSMVVGIPILGGTKLYNYGYDQLNRIVRMDAWKGYNPATGSWSGVQKTDEYKEQISYDANGNILSYKRNGNDGQLNMDNLVYGYNKDGNNNLTNNRLRHVKDDIAFSGNYTEDIDNQSDDNYGYDAIGNLTSDNAEKISGIKWSVYGKILKITKTATADGDVEAISYTYDVAGNRISKKVEKQNQPDKYTWYVRDASGSVMGVYEGSGSTLTLNEQHIYGSSRLGVWNRNLDMDASTSIINYNFTRGNKFFELSNHLGNVLVTVSDKKIGHDAGGGIIDYYDADVVSANDYYPGGMQMPGRKYSAGNLYRYGFNGKENDHEVKGESNQQDYGFRIYDPRAVRFLSVDPITAKYPELTPYQFASNNPISGIDQDGLEYIHFTVILNKDGTVFRKVIAEDFRNRSESEMNKMHNTKDFYKQYSAGFGPEGKGVKYTYFQMTSDGQLNFVNTKNDWEVRQNDIGSEITRHGLYAGEGSITTRGPNFAPKEGEKVAGTGFYDFGYKPIDMGDALSRTHDKEEDFVGFKGWQDPTNIFADIRFVKGLEKYLEAAKDENYIDPYTGRKPSAEGINFAKNAITLFKTEIAKKKAKIISQAYGGKISKALFQRIEKTIQYTESQPVTLPVPDKKDQ